MGGRGSKSTSKVAIDTSLAVQALARNVMSCTSQTAVSQLFQISGSYNIIKNTKQVQAIKFNSTCTQSAQNIADLQQTVANAISNAASATGSGVLSALGASQSEAETVIKQNVSQSITQETIQTIVNNSAAQQAIIISGNNNIVDNFDQSQTLDIVLKNCQDVINNLKSVQAMNNVADQTSSAVTTNPISDIIDSVGSIFEGFGWMGTIILVAAIIGFVLVGPKTIAAFMGSDSNDSSEQPMNYQQQPMMQPMNYQPMPMPMQPSIQQSY
jgi:hypothetical protein